MPSTESGGCEQHAAIRPEDTGRNRPVVLSALKRRPAAILRIGVPLASESGPSGLTRTVKLEVWAVTWSATLAPSHGDDARSHSRPAH